MDTVPIEGGKKFKVKPDPRKGMLTLERGIDGMLHIYWKLRPTATVCEDFNIFPGAQTFEKVDTGREDDRIYLLQCKGQERRRFFWMQEPNAEKDKDNLKQLADAMALGGHAMSAGGMPGSGGAASGGNSAMMRTLFESLRGGPGSTPASTSSPPATTGEGASSGAAGISTDDFEAALMAAENNMQHVEPDAPLNAIIRGSTLEEFVRDDTQDHSDLIQHLPPGIQNLEELRTTTTSPQLSQALRRLSAALSSDNYNSIMANFGLDPTAGAEAMMRGHNIEAFLRAIEAQSENEDGGDDGASKEAGAGADK